MADIRIHVKDFYIVDDFDNRAKAPLFLNLKKDSVIKKLYNGKEKVKDIIEYLSGNRIS